MSTENLHWMPAGLQKEMGHFNVLRHEDHGKPRLGPYRRIDFYKISYVRSGRFRISYADKVIEVHDETLLFSNPLIPYKWENLSEGDTHTGYFCIFTEAFFRQSGHLREYPLFQPGNTPVFPLTAAQGVAVAGVFERMLAEIGSDYTYKYDVLRNQVSELVHLAMKMQPAASSIYANSNASVRISSLFMELMERQFPIESPGQQVSLRSASQFASHLAVHTNHLNRALREVSGKTTTQLIAERLVQEAKSLLRHTNWNIGEVAWSLGFEERSHFINFFKKNTQLSPGAFREQH